MSMNEIELVFSLCERKVHGVGVCGERERERGSQGVCV